MASSSTSPPPPAAVEANETRNWLELPRDVTAAILHRLGTVEILETAQKVCTTWREICKDPAMWRSIDLCTFGDLEGMPYNLEKMARHAVDRSCGELVDFNLEYFGFGTDEILQYISERAPQLRRLRLVYCYYVSDKGLSEAAKKLPLLEELIIIFSDISGTGLANVGRCCPKLTSLRFNNHGSPAQYMASAPYMVSDDEALAIAETMPGLRRLQLFRNKMTNKGLQAILDGCPHLESLDLRRCFKVNLGGTLGKLCSERIKDLRGPYDSTDDYGFHATVFDEYASGDDDSLDMYPYGYYDIEGYTDDDEYIRWNSIADGMLGQYVFWRTQWKWRWYP